MAFDKADRKNRLALTKAGGSRLRNLRRGLHVESLEDRRMLACTDPFILEVPSSIEGEIEVSGEVDCFSFNAEDGGFYNIWTDAGSLVRRRLRLLDDDGNLLARNSSSSETNLSLVTWRATESDSLFVEVAAEFSDLVGTYTISIAEVEDDHGDTSDDATEIEIPSIATGRFDYELDDDVFRFVPEPGNLYEFSSTLDTRINLFGADGLFIDSINVFSEDHAISWLAQNDNEHFISIEDISFGGFDTYELTISELDNTFPDDHGNVPATATPLSPFLPQLGEINFADDRDVFSFDAVAGEQFEIVVDPFESLSAQVLDGDGSVLADIFLDDFFTPGWVAPVDGTFYLSIYGAPDTQYGVEVNPVASDDHGNVPSEATRIGVPSTTDGELGSGDVDYFVFNAVAGRTYNFGTLGGNLAAELKLLDSDGETELFFDIAQDGSFFSWEPTQTGDLYIALDEFFFGPSSYTITIETVGDDHGNEIGGATPISIPTTTTGKIDFVEDRDVFSFDVVAGTVYGFDFSSDQGFGVEFFLLDGNGDEIQFFFEFEQDANWLADETTTVYLLAYSFDSLGTTYTIDIAPVLYEDDHGNTADLATPLEVPSLSLGNRIEVVRDVDFFSFRPVAGELYNFELTEASQITLLGSDGITEITTSSDLISWQATSSEIHFLRINGVFNGIGSYDLEIVGTADQYGDNADAATAITLPFTTKTRIDSENDNDFFSFFATAGSLYRSFTVGDDGVFVNVEIYDVDGFTRLTDPGSREFRWVAPNDGTYFINATSFETGDYILHAERIDYADDFPNSTELAPLLELPTTFDGRIEVEGDVDVISFDAVAGTTYDFWTDSERNAGNGWRVRSSAGAEFEVFSSWMAPADGTFYLEVFSRNIRDFGDYTVTVSPRTDDHGDFFSDATAITVPFETVGQINHLTDLDTFKFDAIAGQSYEFVTGNNKVMVLRGLAGNTIAIGSGGLTWTAREDQTVALSVGGNESFSEYPLFIGQISSTDDFGDTPDTAEPISSPSNTKGFIGEPEDVDVFSLTTIADTTYVFDLEPGSVGGWVLRVLGENGQTMLAEAAGLSEGFPITWTATTTGTIYLEVREIGGSEIGSYFLDVATAVDVHGNTLATATPLTVPSTTNSRLEVPGDIDVFSFTATAGTLYNFNRGRLLDTDGTTLLSAAGDTRWMAPTSDTYFIQISNLFEPYTYSLKLTAPAYVDDHGNTYLTPTFVESPSIKAGRFETIGDVDYFVFVSTADQSYNFIVGTERFDSKRVTLLDRDGQVVLPASPRIAWTAPDAAVYYLKTENTGQFIFAENYALEIQTVGDEHGDSRDDATPVELPAVLESAIDSPGDKDYFSFTATAGTIFDVTGRIRMGIENSDGDDVVGHLFPETRPYTWRAPADGTYFLVLSDEEHIINADYKVELSARGPDDHGNVPTMATSLTLPAVINARLDAPVDSDFFSFDAEKDKFYRLGVSPDSAPQALMWLFDTDGTTQLRPITDPITWSAPADGTYYLQVISNDDLSPVGFLTGTYVVQVEAPDDDFGNVQDAASPIAVPGPTNGRLEFEEDRDVFQFSPQAGALYDISVTSGWVTLYDENEGFVGFDADGGSIHWVAPDDANYFAEVREREALFVGDYTLNIVEVDYDDDHSNLAIGATVIDVDSAVSGNIEVFGDEDFFSFDATANVPYAITMTSISNFVVEVVDPEGNATEIGSTPQVFVPSLDGDHSIRVRDRVNDNTGTYELSVALATDDHANTIENATSIAFPFELDEEMDYVGDVDFFSFPAEGGRTYVFRHRALAGFTQARILDDRGEVRSDVWILNSGWSTVLWTAPFHGNFLLDVRHFFPPRGTPRPGNYQITAAEDQGEQRGDSELLALDSPASGSIDFSGDDDFFRFAATPEVEYTITLSLDGLDDARMDLISEDEEVLVSRRIRGTGDVSITLTVPSTGPILVIDNYYIRISSVNDAFGSYSVSLAADRLPCDFVGDGDGCDINDLNALYEGTNGAPQPLSLDLITQWLEDASDPRNPLKSDPNDVYVMGDSDLDGDVLSGDCGIVLNHYNKPVVGWSNGDLNGDGVVNSADLGLQLNNFGFESEATRSRKFERIRDKEENEDKNDTIDSIFAGE